MPVILNREVNSFKGCVVENSCTRNMMIIVAHSILRKSEYTGFYSSLQSPHLLPHLTLEWLRTPSLNLISLHAQSSKTTFSFLDLNAMYILMTSKFTQLIIPMSSWFCLNLFPVLNVPLPSQHFPGSVSYLQP